jgi:hypothetical protein
MDWLRKPVPLLIAFKGGSTKNSLADRKQAISTLFSLAAYKRFNGYDNMSSADARRIQ